MQQWLMARPEFREFLPTRIMVAYPEAWMDRVDAMKKVQGWTDTSVLNFRNLGVFGEQILLSIRYSFQIRPGLPGMPRHAFNMHPGALPRLVCWCSQVSFLCLVDQVVAGAPGEGHDGQGGVFVGVGGEGGAVG